MTLNEDQGNRIENTLAWWVLENRETTRTDQLTNSRSKRDQSGVRGLSKQDAAHVLLRLVLHEDLQLLAAAGRQVPQDDGICRRAGWALETHLQLAAVQLVGFCDDINSI